jgi:hypothetical protein
MVKPAPRVVGIYHLGLVVVSLICLGAACSSTDHPGPPEPAGFAGNYSVFLRHTATDAQCAALVDQLRGVARSALYNYAQVSGVFIVQLTKGSPASLTDKVVAVLTRSPAVDHVESGGCDTYTRMAACEQWRSTANCS